MKVMCTTTVYMSRVALSLAGLCVVITAGIYYDTQLVPYVIGCCVYGWSSAKFLPIASVRYEQI